MKVSETWLELCPGPRWGSMQHTPDPLTGFKGPTSGGRQKGREGRAREGKKGGKGTYF